MEGERQHAQRALEEARAAGQHLKASAGEIAEAGKETAGRLGNAWESTRTNLQEKAVTGAKATDRVIRDHPYESLGVAFGIGVLIGVLINRK